LRASTPQSASNASPTNRNADAVILWYKHDLRVDDHPGLHMALSFTEGVEVIPYFCFDPARYARLAHNTSSAAALRQAVHSLSSDLVAKFGFRGGLRVESGHTWEECFVKLVRQTGATRIITEQEIETYPWVQGVEAVRAVLAKESLPCDIVTWNTPLFDGNTTENGTAVDVAITFDAWKRRQKHVCQPLDVPSSRKTPNLAPEGGEQTRDELPEAEELVRLSMDACLKSIQVPEFAESLFCTSRDYATEAESEEVDENDAQALVRQAFEVQLTPDGEWEAELAAELAAGEGPVINALKSYLEHVETCADGGGDSRNDWEWKLGKVIARYDVPAAPDGCFPALFTKAFGLGVVSRRRAYTEALKRLQDGGQESAGNQADVNLGSGVLGLLGWLLTSNGGALARRRKLRKGLAVVAAAEAGEFHAALASDKAMLKQIRATNLQLGHWRWRGLLAEYLYSGPELANNGNYPNRAENNVAVLLVHGFGAFGGHWRDNIDAFARKGYDVYAVTLPGYGRSEKPSMPYDQDMWRDYLADFVRYVIRKPVVAIGNSIGGFLVASLAADMPKAVVGLVLVNSAGLLKENYLRDQKSSAYGKPKKPSPPRFIVEGVSRALFAFLQGDVTNQLKRVYPVAPERADAWLGREISRASGDPGALGVFRSVFYLPKPRSLNFLVSDCFGGPTLVVQGVKDPLNDARKRAKELGRLCENVRVETVNAGHCPHDEIPDVFNALVLEFMEELVIPAFQKDRNVSIESGVSSGS
jgi:pimeloyl-ACP methyl ester carboxylesterase